MTSRDEMETRGRAARATTVYLDQFAWVELASARLGRAKSAEGVSARRALHAARLSDIAAFPLSAAHYLETWRQGRMRKRGEVAAEMAVLSGFLTLAPAKALWPAEIDTALQARFGRPVDPRPVEPFGFGCDHALAIRSDVGPDRSGLTAEDVFLAEWAILAGRGEDRFLDEERRRYVNGERFADLETARSRVLKQWRTDPRDRMQRFRLQAVMDFHRDFVAAFIVADIAPSELEALGADGLEELVQAVSTVYVLTELRRIRYGNPDQEFKRTDLDDLRALATAVPYCDIVVTDKAWADALRRTELPERFGTTVCRSLAEAVCSLDQCRRSEHLP